MKLEKNIFRLFFVLLCLIGAISCGKTDEVEPVTSITLSVDKTTLKSDGKEVVTFKVVADGQDVSRSATITYEDEANTTLSSNTFSTNTPGTYKFYATYGGISSTEVQVEAVSAVLVLSVDATSIKANGKSAVTFQITADGENITSKAEITHKYGDTENTLESNVFTTETSGEHKFYCKYKDVISDTITVTANPFVLTLSVDTTKIKANGKDAVSFIVKADDDDVTKESSIYLKNGEQSEKLDSTKFVTTKEGTYEFYAEYKGTTSNDTTITAIASSLTIIPDKTEIKTGETVSFSAILDDVYDVSSSVILHISKNGAEETTVSGNIFAALSFGTYTIYATYNGQESNSTEIKVSPSIVTISADKTSIKATEADAVTFTVLVDGQNISGAKIVQKGAVETTLSGNTFTSGTVGTYSFYATYDNVKSSDVSITVNKATFFKQSCAIEVVSTGCGYSPQMIEAFESVYQNRASNNIQIISIHLSTSDLQTSSISGDNFILHYGQTGIPYGKMDLNTTLSRSATAIENAALFMKSSYPATSGIAVTSKKNDNSIDFTLKVKVDETNEYAVCAIVVEDGIVSKQKYISSDGKSYYYNDAFVHDGVADYIIQDDNNQYVYPYSGISLGTIQAGNEVTKTFSIPIDGYITYEYGVTMKRKVDYSKCRIVAYVMKKNGSNLYINNATTCSIDGSVNYKYE